MNPTVVESALVSATNMRALGRLGEPVSAATGRRRNRIARRGGHEPFVTRRPRVPRALLATLGVVVLALAWLGATANGQVAHDAAGLAAQAALTTEALPRPAVGASRSQPRGTGTVFAVVDGLELVLPHDAPLLVGFHEASRAEALPLQPVGRLLGNDNATKFDAQPDAAGPDYRVLSSRGRARPATSAVDVALGEGVTVTAPVSGEVVEVREYDLTGSVRDWRVVVAPSGRSDLHVVLIHLHQPVVAVGDVVVAGESPLAMVRQLPFDSHVDYALGQRQPHTHIEVKPAVAPAPLDPNAPALEAGAEL